MNKRLYVGNLSYNVNDKELQELFAQVGTVLYAKVITRTDGKSKGFGFVEMSTEEEAKAAAEKYENFMLNNREMKVSEAKAQDQPRSSYGNARRGGFGNNRGGAGGGGYRGTGSGGGRSGGGAGFGSRTSGSGGRSGGGAGFGSRTSGSGGRSGGGAGFGSRTAGPSTGSTGSGYKSRYSSDGASAGKSDLNLKLIKLRKDLNSKISKKDT